MDEGFDDGRSNQLCRYEAIACLIVGFIDVNRDYESNVGKYAIDQALIDDGERDDGLVLIAELPKEHFLAVR